jgi:hypothetical protein
VTGWGWGTGLTRDEAAQPIHSQQLALGYSGKHASQVGLGLGDFHNPYVVL